MANENNVQNQNSTSEIAVRREKLNNLYASGNNPFEITKYDRTHESRDAIALFEEKEPTLAEGETITVRLAGRMVSRRIMGKASFAHMLDGQGKIQLYVARDGVGEEVYAGFKKWDVGDIIGVEGHLFRTRTGEISVHATSITLLAKSLLPLPEKFHGLTDLETRYRQRYVDLIVNPEVKRNFVIRSQFIKFMRNYLDERGYIEVETPVLNTIVGGASARPFITHHNTLDIDMYMRIATELPLKRLIVGGMEKVYEIGRIFRNEGMDPKHNPEFTSIELYEAFTDYYGMMDLVEELYKMLAREVCGSTTITYQGIEIDMSKWERLTMVEAVKMEGFTLDRVSMDEKTRAAIWYAKDGTITDSNLGGIKAVRECENFEIRNTTILSQEFGWKSKNITLADCDLTAEYVFFDSRDVKLDRVRMKGKYSFQYMENLEINDSYLDTKDAFWHSKNVTVRNSTVKGEYLAWFSEGLTLINCHIIGTQPLCYCKNLTLINCTMEGTDLSFEYSDVQADVVGHIDSVKNPRSGVITADSVGEIILGDAVMECTGKVCIR